LKSALPCTTYYYKYIWYYFKKTMAVHGACGEKNRRLAFIVPLPLAAHVACGERKRMDATRRQFITGEKN
jgi:hypothetical protein